MKFKQAHSSNYFHLWVNYKKFNLKNKILKKDAAKEMSYGLWELINWQTKLSMKILKIKLLKKGVLIYKVCVKCTRKILNM